MSKCYTSDNDITITKLFKPLIDLKFPVSISQTARYAHAVQLQVIFLLWNRRPITYKQSLLFPGKTEQKQTRGAKNGNVSSLFTDCLFIGNFLDFLTIVYLFIGIFRIQKYCLFIYWYFEKLIYCHRYWFQHFVKVCPILVKIAQFSCSFGQPLLVFSPIEHPFYWHFEVSNIFVSFKMRLFGSVGKLSAPLGKFYRFKPKAFFC